MATDKILNDALAQAAREVGTALTPYELSKRGVNRVRLVPREKMAALIQKAAEKLVQERESKAGDVSHLVDDVQTSLLGLLHGAQEVENARRDIAEQRHTLQDELTAIVHEREPARDPAPGSTSSKSLAKRAPGDDTVDRLERRIAKLIATLKDTELALQRALTSQSLGTGIESLYRVVQGLGADESQLEQKREMMKKIFLANLELNSLFEQGRAAPES